jgi:O-antigen ligase
MFQHLSRRALLPFAIAAILGVAVVWTASPYLRWRINHAITEYSEYKSENQMTSSGERLEFWRKSAKFFLEAPLIGHGTGSTQSLFEKDAIGKTKASAEVTANPHNQTLYFAVQWGIIGVALLFAMWTVHFLKFLGTGWGAWLGMIVVTQNIVGSVFNSHISDFVEGWIYVIGVGVAVGMISRSRKPEWVAATTT